MPGTEENPQPLLCALEEYNAAMSLVRLEPGDELIQSHGEEKSVTRLRKRLGDWITARPNQSTHSKQHRTES